MATIKNEIGNKYNLLTVINKAPSKNGKAYWECQCECGRKHIVSGSNLRTGAVKSCGQCIYNNKKQDLTGKTFGVLKVIREIPNQPKSTWECECIYCGRRHQVAGTNLKTGHTKSCTCVTGSTGEKIISELLKTYKIKFQQQYSFPDFKLESGGIPKFDFAIFTKNNQLLCLIEFDGEQHYIITGGWNKEEKHNETIFRDNEKNSYCEKNEIPLIRIPFYDINNINILYLLKKIEEKVNV